MLVVACAQFNRVGISVIGAERIIPVEKVDRADMGLIYSGFLLLYTVAMLPGGWFIDRFGARRALTILGFSSALFLVLSACTSLFRPNVLGLWLSLLLVRSMMGAFNAPLHPGAAQLVGQRVHWQSRALGNGLVTFSACVGISATYPVLGLLIDRFDWPTALLMTSAVTLAVSIAWVVASRHFAANGSEQAAAARHRASLDEVWSLMCRGSVICLTLSYALMGYFQYLFFYWIEFFFETMQKEDKSVARGYSAMITMAMGLGMVCGGWLTDHAPRSLSFRARRALVPMLCLIASGAIFEAGLLVGEPNLMLVAFTISAALIGCCEGAFWTTAVGLGGRLGGTCGGLMNAGGNLGGTISPYLTPILGAMFAKSHGEDVGWRISLAIAGLIGILGGFLWLGVDPTPPPEDRITPSDGEPHSPRRP